MYCVAMEDTVIIELDGATAAARIHELVDLLQDAVAHGASVNFLAGLTASDARSFWSEVAVGVESGRQVLLVAERDGTIVGTAILTPAPQPNQPHRADVGKMLVHSSARRLGLGSALLVAIEQLADRQGRTLLMLDTEKGSAGEHLYTASGWTKYGEVPGHAQQTDGTPQPTSFFYKRLR